MITYDEAQAAQRQRNGDAHRISRDAFQAIQTKHRLDAAYPATIHPLSGTHTPEDQSAFLADCINQLTKAACRIATIELHSQP